MPAQMNHCSVSRDDSSKMKCPNGPLSSNVSFTFVLMNISEAKPPGINLAQISSAPRFEGGFKME